MYRPLNLLEVLLVEHKLVHCHLVLLIQQELRNLVRQESIAVSPLVPRSLFIQKHAHYRVDKLYVSWGLLLCEESPHGCNPNSHFPQRHKVGKVGFLVLPGCNIVLLKELQTVVTLLSSLTLFLILERGLPQIPVLPFSANHSVAELNLRAVILD